MINLGNTFRAAVGIAIGSVIAYKYGALPFQDAANMALTLGLGVIIGQYVERPRDDKSHNDCHKNDDLRP